MKNIFNDIISCFKKKPTITSNEDTGPISPPPETPESQYEINTDNYWAGSLPKFALDKIEFSDSSVISNLENKVIVFVGPNNSGKTKALKDIFTLTGSLKSEKTKVVRNISFGQFPDVCELKHWISNNFDNKYPEHESIDYFGVRIGSYDRRDIDKAKPTEGLGDINKLLALQLDTNTRLEICKPPDSIDLIREVPAHPFHVLQRDDKIANTVSKVIKNTFNKDLIFHPCSGKRVEAYFDDKPTLDKESSLTAITNLRRFEKLELLEDQGDGIRAFTGILTSVLTVPAPIILIDEPESFLHPPQAKIIGNLISKETVANKQIFIATHSVEVINGILENDPKNVVLVRISRKDDINPINELKSEDILSIKSDSFFKYTNALDALFYDNCIICEAEVDCNFYHAISLCLDTAKEDISNLWLPSGGKQRIPKIAKIINSTVVNTKLVFDIDILRDKNNIKNAIECMGSSWSDFEKEWMSVSGILKDKAKIPKIVDVKSEIKSKIDKINNEESSDSNVLSEICNQLKSLTRWGYIKKFGLEVVSGTDYDLLANFLKSLEGVGIFIVPCGELESWDRNIGGKSGKWADKALENLHENKASFSDCISFIKKVLA